MTHKQRLILLISILASFVAFLDGSVVNVALPAIARDLGGGLVLQQWVVDAYLITLGSLILVAGSLSDLFGRRRIITIGLLGFGIASVLCAVAPNGTFLVVSRAIQGIAGALLVPSSLALIIANFEGPAEGKAIGSWTAWTGIAFIIGPLVGGGLVDSASWRFIFAINVVPIAITLGLLHIAKPPAHLPQASQIDLGGALYGVLGLGAPVFAFIEQSRYGWGNPIIYIPLAAGVIAMALFVWHERRTPEPMLPLGLFRNRNFSAGNLATLFIYGGLSIATFMITVALQQIGGYGALAAGLALLPVTLLMFTLSSRFGKLAGTYGPHLFMALGPLIMASSFVVLSISLDARMAYWTQLLPGVTLFGLGLAVTVAPLTAAVLGSIAPERAGIASAVNNAVARSAGLVAIAGLAVVTGPTLALSGVRRGCLAVAGLTALGGVVSWLGIQNRHKTKRRQQKQSATAEY
jgi:EmrB/QacA subfamily drug resistance transporter